MRAGGLAIGGLAFDLSKEAVAAAVATVQYGGFQLERASISPMPRAQHSKPSCGAGPPCQDLLLHFYL